MSENNTPYKSKKLSRKEIADAVCKVLNETEVKKKMSASYTFNNNLRYIIGVLTGISITERQLRYAIETLRNEGRLRLFIGNSNRGYKFATTTQEIQDYLKLLHARAMKLHKLFAVEKAQAEIDLGCQLGIEFFSELYSGKDKA